MVSMVASEANERKRASKRQSSLSISTQPTKAVVSPRSSPLGTSVVKHFITAELSNASQLLQVLIILTIVFFSVRMSKLRES